MEIIKWKNFEGVCLRFTNSCEERILLYYLAAYILLLYRFVEWMQIVNFPLLKRYLILPVSVRLSENVCRDAHWDGHFQ